jgi:hypothetical protein
MNQSKKSLIRLAAIAIMWISGLTALGIGILGVITKNLTPIQSAIPIAYGLIAVVWNILFMRKKVGKWLI